MRPALTGKTRRPDQGRTRAVLDDAVVVLVRPRNQSGIFPGFEPGWRGGITDVGNGGQQIGTCEGRHGRRGGVENGDEQQCVAC
ncbi:hypothetical protein D3C84_1187340 [compost metagenome]